MSIWSDLQENPAQILEEGERALLNCQRCDWDDADAPNTPGIYWVENKQGELIYLGQSSNIRERYTNHSGHTYISPLRRRIATELLGFKLQEINGEKRYLLKDEDTRVTDFLRGCQIKFLPVLFGRYELEEYLIKKHNPSLNRKGRDKAKS